VQQPQANSLQRLACGKSYGFPSARPEGSIPEGVALCGIAWKIIAAILICSISAFPLPRKEKDATQYGMGLIVNLPFPEAEVEQVVQEVIQNGTIRGTKEYNKDEYISGANPVTSTKVFPDPVENGKAYYKVRLTALDPRNFKDSSDVGTLAVRYVVQAQGEKNTVLRIDARFVEDFRRVSHASNGSVEGAEYKNIHEHLESIELMKQQTAEALKEKGAQAAQKQESALVDATPAVSPSVAAVSASDDPSKYSSSKASSTESAPPTAVPSTAVPSAAVPSNDAPSNVPPAGNTPSNAAPPETASTISAPTGPPQTLEQHVQDLRRQVQRLVKSPGAALKSAPFHTATTLQSLPTGSEVLIVISTTYWLGVETHEGQHGWILRDELELLP
jgi:hypothetical protein